jgi:hypothetical protein
MATKLVPKLSPEHECTMVPQEICHLHYGQPQIVMKPFMTEWCLDESEVIEADAVNEETVILAGNQDTGNEKNEALQSRGRRIRNRRRKPLRRRFNRKQN